MSNNLVSKIMHSVSDLEGAVRKAKSTISNLPTPRPDLLQRLECYEQVLVKQKVLAVSLFRYAQLKDWDQVKRHAELIRGSSVLIQVDIKAIIEELIAGPAKSRPDSFQA